MAGSSCRGGVRMASRGVTRYAALGAYLAALSRRPTAAEAAHFEAALADQALPRAQTLHDLYWALLNSTEFSWNH